MEVSPSKRRVLGSLDLNALSPNPPRTLKPLKTADAPPPPSRQYAAESKKRPLAPKVWTEQQPAKKVCLGGPDEGRTNNTPRAPSRLSPRPSERHRSESPAASSLFDVSGFDSTRSTAITDPDVVADAPAVVALASASASTVELPASALPRPPATRPRLTREQAREKAEILRLRLGLASYKVRTGQTDVPLEHLQVRPLPGASPPRPAGIRSPLPGSSFGRKPRVSLPTGRSATKAFGLGSSQSFTRESSSSSIGDGEIGNSKDSPRREESGVRGDGLRPCASSQPAPPPSPPRSPSLEPKSDSELESDPEPELESEQEPERLALPRLPPPRPFDTPRRQQHLSPEEGGDAEKLTSSALRGGAASGLLSLARG